MEPFEEQSLFYDQIGLVIQGLALLVSAFFYYQLVRNDNRRSRQVEEDQIISWCINHFRKKGGSPEELQMAGHVARSRYPKEVKLIVIAFERLVMSEQIPGAKTVEEFLALMNKLGMDLWPRSYREAMSLKS